MRSKPCLIMTMMWIVLVFAVGNLCFGQTYWKRTYGDKAYNLIIPTVDGNFLIEGTTFASNLDTGDSYLLKIKPNGDTLWTRAFKNLSLDTIIFTSDGNYFLIGNPLIKIKPNGDILWMKTYEGIPKLTIPTNDSNFLISAEIPTSSTGSTGILLLKINQQGDILWTKTYGKLRNDPNYFQYLILLKNDDFLIKELYSSSDSANVRLLNLNWNGDTIWTRRFHGTSGPILPTADGYVLMEGIIPDSSKKTQGFGIIKMRTDGAIIWTKFFERRQNYSSSVNIFPMNDGNFLIGGSEVIQYDFICKKSFLIKINSNGDTIWTKTLEEFEMDQIYQLKNGNFIVSGRSVWCSDLLMLYTLGKVIQINPDGNILWDKVFRGDGLNQVFATRDDKIIIGGTIDTFVFQHGNSDAILRKINLNGDSQWTTTFGGTGNDAFLQMIQTSDGNYLMSGILSSLPSDSGKFWLICIIADQYAYKDSLFTYKIPTYGLDTLSFNYTPLIVPSGMKVNTGGTISWTPKTDSVYMDHAEFQVVNDAGRIDTLTFNIFVNSDYHLPVKHFKINKNAPNTFKINAKPLKNQIKFSLPYSATTLCIYDINGRIVDKITPTIFGSEAYAVWPGASLRSRTIPFGKYFAKIIIKGNNAAVKPFLFCR